MPLPPTTLRQCVRAFARHSFARKAALVIAACAALWGQSQPALAEQAAEPAAESWITTSAGLRYADIRVGDGAEAIAGRVVQVHYTGWLKGKFGIPGREFDSSRQKNEPFQFRLGTGQVIAGWDEGVQGMRVGGFRKLIVPAALGYGRQGAGAAIPPNATLIFDVELLGVN